MSLNIIIIIDLFVHCSAVFVGKINIVLYTVYCLFTIFYCFLPLNSWSKNCSPIQYVGCLQDCNCRKDCKLADGQLKYDNQTWQDSCQICTCQVSQHATAMT
jgi:hypothetical protein